MAGHRKKLYTTLFAALTLAGCSTPVRQVGRVELLILPKVYVVDGVEFSTANEAVTAVLTKQPAMVALPACGAMATKRVVDVTKLLTASFGGVVTMSVLGEGERGCPGYSS